MAEVSFEITCTMNERWVDYFLSFLKHMETNGYVGHSELVGFDSDGDGDFRPRFDFNKKYVTKSPKVYDAKERPRFFPFYDAG